MKRIAALAFTALLLASTSAPASAFGGISIQVIDWTAPDGHAFVGVQADGQWATPSSSGYCSEWVLKAVVAPNEWVYWVWVHQNGCSGPVVNFTNPRQVITTLYDPKTGTFSATGSMTTARVGSTATLLSDGRVLVAGGSASQSSPILPSADLYDPKTGTFSATGSMTTARVGSTATLLSDGRVLVAGGFTLSNGQGEATASAELYQP
jgi:hypothetical protein